MNTAINAQHMLEQIQSGRRRPLAQALSLVESSLPADRATADQLLEIVSTQETGDTRRIAVSGAPGVGKSTLLEAFGLRLAAQGHKVAILTVDPSSHRTGGSILGDKVRMPKLATLDEVYIRPSATRLADGGVTSTTRDAIMVCEAAGYDTIIVETVGVGQNEIAAASMVDLFVLLVLPTAGDELQGIKRGIMEVGDIVLINKADIDPTATHRARAMYKSALRLLLPPREQWNTTVLTASATTDGGIDEFCTTVEQFFSAERRRVIQAERIRQRVQWFDDTLKNSLLLQLDSVPTLASASTILRLKVLRGEVHPSLAARRFIQSLSFTFDGSSI